MVNQGIPPLTIPFAAVAAGAGDWGSSDGAGGQGQV